MGQGKQERSIPLLTLLRSEVGTLPGQAGKLARTILQDPRAAARMSIAELAATAGTSEASVTRLAQRLGYDGLPDLRLALATEAAAPVDATTIAGDVVLEDDTATVRTKVLADLTRSLGDTAAALDDAEVDAVAAAVVGARRTLVVGVGASGIVAVDLTQKLERIGLPALALTEYHHAVTSCVAVTEHDVVLGVSHSGETLDVLEPLEAAAARGATTVALTSRSGSALARVSDHVLLSVAGTDNEFRPAAMASRAAQLFVVDVLFVVVVQRDRPRAAPLLSASWEALSQRHPDRQPARGRASGRRQDGQ